MERSSKQNCRDIAPLPVRIESAWWNEPEHAHTNAALNCGGLNTDRNAKGNLSE